MATLAPDVLAALVEVAPTALIAIDAQGRVRLCNRAAAALCGVSAASALGRPLAEVVPALVESGAHAGEIAQGRLRLNFEVAAAGSWQVYALRAPERRDEPAPPTGPPALRRRGRVLIAEDNLVTQRVTAAVLARLGVACEIAGNGREALARLADGPFDLVLMDCQMPELDGFAATRAIREAPGPLRAIPVVAMTSSSLAEDRAQCLAAGMDDCVVKPMSLDEVTRVLTRWLAAPDEAPVDAEALADLAAELGAEEVAGLVERLLGQVQTNLSQMRGAVAGGDLAAAAAAAHVLIGAAGALGAVGVVTAARELERVCQWPAPRRLGEALRGVEDAARAAEPALRAWVEQVRGAG